MLLRKPATEALWMISAAGRPLGYGFVRAGGIVAESKVGTKLCDLIVQMSAPAAGFRSNGGLMSSNLDYCEQSSLSRAPVSYLLKALAVGDFDLAAFRFYEALCLEAVQQA